MPTKLEVLAKKHLWPAYQKFVKDAGEFPTAHWSETVLVGPGSHMDSLKFVHFLIEVEQRLKADKKLSRGLSSPEPFRSMGSFAEHIAKTLKEELSL